MKCEQCNNEQFFTVYIEGVKTGWKCSKCGDIKPLKKNKKSKVDKDIDNIEEVN